MRWACWIFSVYSLTIYGEESRGFRIGMAWLLCYHERFPARPADPDPSVFAELFPAPQPEPSQPEPSQPNVPTAKAKQMHLDWNPLGFLSELSKQKSVTRFPPDVWQAFFCRSFGAPIPKMLAHAHSRTLCSCKMRIDPLGDHVLTYRFYSRPQSSHGCGGILVA